MIGHLHGMLTTGSCNGLGKTRFGGFFYGRMKSNGCEALALAAIFLQAVEFRRSAFGDVRAQFQRPRGA
jgi:hypothetical protein